MIRAVLDTNIYVSAFFWGGLPLTALEMATTGIFRIVISVELIDELRDVISRDKFSKRLNEIGETVDSLLDENFLALVEVVEAAEIKAIVVDDPDDDILIVCAVGGEADYIVSGDKHLLDLETYSGIKIRKLRQFMDVFAK